MIDSLSVFFPAYNEEKNIESTVIKAVEVLKKLKIKNFETIIIEDGQVDRTGEIVKRLAQKDRRIRLITYRENRGYGHALKMGFRNSKYPWVAFSDADGQFDFSEISNFLDYTDQADLILGYRLERADSLSRTIFTLGWGLLARILLGLKVKDYSCGFKLIKRAVFEGVEPLETEEKVTQIEMFVKAQRKGFKFVDVGVHHYPRKFGNQTGAKMSVVIKSLADLFSLWWKVR